MLPGCSLTSLVFHWVAKRAPMLAVAPTATSLQLSSQRLNQIPPPPLSLVEAANRPVPPQLVVRLEVCGGAAASAATANNGEDFLLEMLDRFQGQMHAEESQRRQLALDSSVVSQNPVRRSRSQY